KVKGISKEAIFKEMKTWYNGYAFTENPEAQKVYNPFSVLYYMQKQQLENYWFESGTPTFLIELLKSHYPSPEGLENIVVSRKSLFAFDIEAKLPVFTLLFQMGYLTIKSYDPKLKAYVLGCPNEEVKFSLTTCLMAIATNADDDHV
ncbi:MAG: AAA family ATPase, partial [Verrucomicrobia bacterium]|nr:AAA family ATPase [Verrucomicrobiota bacterium]